MKLTGHINLIGLIRFIRLIKLIELIGHMKLTGLRGLISFRELSRALQDSPRLIRFIMPIKAHGAYKGL